MPCRNVSPLEGSITETIHKARLVGGFALRIEAEVGSEAEADEAINAGADIVMLDNMGGNELKETVSRLRQRWGNKRQFLLESSGNINEHNLVERAASCEIYLIL